MKKEHCGGKQGMNLGRGLCSVELCLKTMNDYGICVAVNLTSKRGEGEGGTKYNSQARCLGTGKYFSSEGNASAPSIPSAVPKQRWAVYKYNSAGKIQLVHRSHSQPDSKVIKTKMHS